MAASPHKHCVVVVDFCDMSAKVLDIGRLKTEAEISARTRNQQYAEQGDFKHAVAVPLELAEAGDPKRFL